MEQYERKLLRLRRKHRDSLRENRYTSAEKKSLRTKYWRRVNEFDLEVAGCDATMAPGHLITGASWLFNRITNGSMVRSLIYHLRWLMCKHTGVQEPANPYLPSFHTWETHWWNRHSVHWSKVIVPRTFPDVKFYYTEMWPRWRLPINRQF
jgi:hypothetical protein